MFTAAYVDMLPKPQRSESNMAPHGKIDNLTMSQWKERHQKALADGTS